MPSRLSLAGDLLPDHEVQIIDEMGGELGWEGRPRISGSSNSQAVSRTRRRPASCSTMDGSIPAIAPIWPAATSSSPAGSKTSLSVPVKPRRTEIEEAVGAIPGLRENEVAAFGIADPASGTERVVILAEVDGNNPLAEAALKVVPGGWNSHCRRSAGQGHCRAAGDGAQDRERQDHRVRRRGTCTSERTWRCRCRWRLARLSFAGPWYSHIAGAWNDRQGSLRRMVM